MIKVENLSKSYGTHLLFDNVSFNINPREKIGLVGRNGHGKTTLFRLLIGEEQPDSGTITIPRYYRFGHVSQHLVFTEKTVLEEGCLGLPEDMRHEAWMLEKILSGLGFTKSDLERSPSELSGGFQVRLNLAKVLVSNPNLLLLDEPTNYLDIVSIRWLSRFLKSWQGELMLITHDRGFMDNVTTHTMGIHRALLRKISGGTDRLYEQILKEEEIYEKTRINDEKKRKDMEDFIRRFRAKARLAGLVQSRVKALEKNEKRSRLEKIKNLDFEFNCDPIPGKYLMDAKDVAFSYSGRGPNLIEDFNITIGKNDRICVIGKNGKGKTTLLRLLAGELKIQTGEINYNANLKMAFFAQTNISRLNNNLTVEEEILSSHPGNDRQAARNICGAMMFEGDFALKKISVLSGGEKSRVLLGKLLVSATNLLLLDEPTNHLDMESSDALLAAVDNYDGAVLMVTHNEMFLHALATRIIAFQRGRVMVYEGGYQSFLEKVGWEEEDRAADEGSDPGDNVINKKELRKMRSDIITRRSKSLKPVEKRIEEIESRIMSTDEKLSADNKLMIEASHSGDGAQISQLSKTIHDSRSLLDRLYDELEALTLKHEDESRRYEVELLSLERENDE